MEHQGLPLTFRCVKGEEWPITSFTSTLDLKVEEPTEDSIVFSCPSYHTFTLRQALAKKIFTQEQGAKMLSFAQEHFILEKRDYEQRVREGWKARPSDYIPNAEVLSKGWKCAKCKKLAKWAPGSPQREDRALCLACRADWDNFGTDNRKIQEIFQASTQKPYWRPIELLNQELWERFLRNELPIPITGASSLLDKYIQQAKQEILERKKERARQKRTK